ncbi:glycine betaine/proline transport system substrate-binding protein [Desulfotomaculum arcticum]|uniref:Glycine betaine/proline transport system substrate-binding protein n=1 Tax=Desulfotruncus arcticus DSM 17038 TaxID=1121424 RepID=A0A1I2ZSP1_9FIRM|nr:ABC transporter substrate-binding protein [Desulfotruncus arcticus]SFH40626.1 glycine betaine/proline transport system substrate-binding protein [Desulfotomaculum arcticum] [Desulfotruncus arcticus DSM 17038]
MTKWSKNKALLVIISLFVMLSLLATGCGSGGGDETAKGKDTIIFADAGWDSIRLHNEIAGFILRNGYGYKTDIIPGGEPSSLTGISTGDIDVYMEIWTGNVIDKYNQLKEDGDIVELGVNFADNKQGLYVPTYVIKGDPERGIKPMAPDLKSIKDLPKYWELFKDPEDPGKGRIYGSIPGWTADTVLQEKYKNYGLDKNFNYFQPGSDTALATSLTSAIKEGKPWVGYYWEPTWITGKYDLTLLEDAPYSDELWEDGYRCEYPSQDLTIAVQKNLPKEAPDVTEFLKHYQTSSALVSEALAYMQDNKATTEDTTKWFLKEHEDLWTEWVPEDVVQKVKAAL